MFKVATWNVNSIRVRLPHVLAWLQEVSPDVLCLQEIKVIDQDFPVTAFEALGYQVMVSGQKTYNGVAILSKKAVYPNDLEFRASPASVIASVSEAIQENQRGSPGLPLPHFVRSRNDCMINPITVFPSFEDLQKRVLAVSVGDLRIINLYVPNGSEVGSEKYSYKLEWLQHLKLFLTTELKQYQKIIVLGDFNIAPEDRDVHDPQAWQGQVLCSSAERAALQEMINLGFVDTFRLFDQPGKSYTWWDYRMMAFRRNMGLRIDHILATPNLSCVFCCIDKKPRALEQPSDHAPVVAGFEL